MVAFSTILLGLAAITPSLAAPAADPLPAHVERRGPNNFILTEDHPLMLARRNVSLEERSTPSYTQNYQTGGTVGFTHSGNTFSTNFNVKQDFVVGIGWNPGSTSPITHTGSFSVTSGLATLSIYGWTTSPLVEYYVIECSQGFSQTGTKKGTVTSDGGTYTVWEHQQVNQPSITGTATFNQYISIRNSCRTSGTVTLNNHFNAWKGYGMNLGKMNLQVVAVETWNGAGSSKQTVSN